MVFQMHDLCEFHRKRFIRQFWQPSSYPLFCMQLLKHVANAMQRAEGFVLKRVLVTIFVYTRHDTDNYTQLTILFGSPSLCQFNHLLIPAVS